MKERFQESTGSIQQWQLSSVKLTAQYHLTPNNIFHSERRRKHNVAHSALISSNVLSC